MSPLALEPVGVQDREKVIATLVSAFISDPVPACSDPHK
jgi:hypothetical protein